MREYAVILIAFLVVLGVMLGIVRLFSGFAEEIKVVAPKEGVECVVVSRMFHTSVDCWEAK